MADREPPKEKDVGQIVRYLASAFNQTTARLERPFRAKTTGPNRLYRLQTEFAYLLNEVVQGPRCILQKNITACNDFIDATNQMLSEEARQAEEAHA